MKLPQNQNSQLVTGNIKNKTSLTPLFNREQVMNRRVSPVNANLTKNSNHDKVKKSEGNPSELTPEQKQALCDKGYKEFCDQDADDQASTTNDHDFHSSNPDTENKHKDSRSVKTQKNRQSHNSHLPSSGPSLKNDISGGSRSSDSDSSSSVSRNPRLRSDSSLSSTSVSTVITATSALNTAEKEARSKLLKAAADFKTMYLLDVSSNLQTKFQSKVMELYRPVFEAKSNLLKTLLKLPTWVFASGETTKIQLEEELVNVERITSKYIDITAMEGLKYLFLNFRAFAFSREITDAEPGLKQVEQYLKSKYNLTVDSYTIAQGFVKPLASQDRFGIIPLLYFTPRFLKAWSKRLGVDYLTMRYMFFHAPGAEGKLYIPKAFTNTSNKLGIEYHSVSVTDSSTELPSAPIHMRKLYDIILQYSQKMKDSVLALYRKSPGYSAVIDFVYQIPRTLMVMVYNAYWSTLLNAVNDIPVMASESFGANLDNNRPANALDIATQLFLMDSQYFVKPYAQLREDLRKQTLPILREFQEEMSAAITPIIQEIEDENYKLFIGDMVVGNRKAEKRTFFLPAMPFNDEWFSTYSDVPNGTILRSPDEWAGKKYITAGGMAYELDDQGVHLKDNAFKTPIEKHQREIKSFITTQLSSGKLAERFQRFLGHFPGVTTDEEKKAAAFLQSVFKMMTPKFAAFTMTSSSYLESPTDAVVKQGVLKLRPWFTDFMVWVKDKPTNTDGVLSRLDLDLLIYPGVAKPHVGYSYFRSILEAHQYEGYQNPYTRSNLNTKAITLFQKALQGHGLGWAVILLHALPIFFRQYYTFETKEYTRKLLSMYDISESKISAENPLQTAQAAPITIVAEQKQQYHDLQTVKTLDWTENRDTHELSVRAYDAIIGTHNWTISLSDNSVKKTNLTDRFLLIRKDLIGDSYLSTSLIEQVLMESGKKGTLYYGEGTNFADLTNQHKYFLEIQHNSLTNLDLATSRRIVIPLTVFVHTAKSTVAYVLETSTHTVDKTYEIKDALLQSSNSWLSNLTRREFGNIEDVKLTISKLFGSQGAKLVGVSRAETAYHPVITNPSDAQSDFSMPILPKLTEYSPLLTRLGIHYQNVFGWVSDDINTDKRMVLENMIYHYPEYVKVPAKYFDHIITKLEKDGVSFEYTTE